MTPQEQDLPPGQGVVQGQGGQTADYFLVVDGDMLVTLSKTLRKVEGQHLKLQLRRVLWPHVRNSFISLLNKPFHNKRGLKLSRGWEEAGSGHRKDTAQATLRPAL